MHLAELKTAKQFSHPSPVGGRWREATDEGLSTGSLLITSFVDRPSSALRAPSPNGGRVNLLGTTHAKN